MQRGLIFAKRNFLEMVRDPLIYIFGLLFPIAMLSLFQIINANIPGAANECFRLTSLVPGILLFSYSFLMIIMSLLVSKDTKRSFMLRLYSSPMKNRDYLLGYTLPTIVIGIIQTIICLSFGALLAFITNDLYFSFFKAVLLMLEMLPMMVMCIFLGLLFGLVLSENSAPGICSVFISGVGIIGGAWMPLDSMKSFERVCLAFPFYPANYLGHIITGAYHSVLNELGQKVAYSFDKLGLISLFVYVFYVLLVISLTVIVFNKKRIIK